MLTVLLLEDGTVCAVLGENGESLDFELDDELNYYHCADCGNFVREDEAEWLDDDPRCYACFKARGHE